MSAIAVSLERAATWFLRAKAETLRRTSLQTYIYAVVEFVLWCGPVNLDDVTGETISAFRQHLAVAGLAPGAVRARLFPVRTFVRWAAAELGGPAIAIELGDNEPEPLALLAVNPADRDVLLAAEAEAAAASPRRRLVALRNIVCLRLLSETACRVAALCSLRLGDVDLERKFVYFRKEKGGKRQVMPFSEKTAGAIRAWLAVRWPTDGDWLFTTRHRTRLTPHALRVNLNALAARLGIEGRVNPHAFRHGWALGAARRRLNFRLIQRGLGHMRAETTMRYLEPTIDDFREALEELAPE